LRIFQQTLSTAALDTKNENCLFSPGDRLQNLFKSLSETQDFSFKKWGIKILSKKHIAPGMTDGIIARIEETSDFLVI